MKIMTKKNLSYITFFCFVYPPFFSFRFFISIFSFNTICKSSLTYNKETNKKRHFYHAYLCNTTILLFGPDIFIFRILNQTFSCQCRDQKKKEQRILDRKWSGESARHRERGESKWVATASICLLPPSFIIYTMVASKSGIAVGINKGHIVTRRELKAKPSNKIGVCIRWMDGLMNQQQKK